MKLDQPGVYAALDAEGLPIYVGQSKLVRQRMLQHQASKNWFKHAVSWVYYPLSPEDSRLELETYLILEYRPRWNQAIKLRIGKDGHLTEVSFLPTRRTR